jgi:RNA polymerase sigma-70 factor (ECF subfamily)
MAAPLLHDDELRLPDEALVERLRTGDHEAFNELYQRYFKRIYAFVDRRMGNRADAEETVQEVFINVFSSIEGYRGEAPFGAWIFGVTRRTIAARFKKKRHPTVSLHEEGGETSTMDAASNWSDIPTPIESYECSERLHTIRRLVKHRLTDEQRQLFELHHLQERPIQEIARSLNKTENSVKSNLYRTRRILLSR